MPPPVSQLRDISVFILLVRALSWPASSWESSYLNPFKHLPLLRGSENDDNENDNDERDIDDDGHNNGSYHVVRAYCCHSLELRYHIHLLNCISQQGPAFRRYSHWLAIITLILQVKNLRPKEVKSPVPGHTASNGRAGNCTQFFLTLCMCFFYYIALLWPWMSRKNTGREGGIHLWQTVASSGFTTQPNVLHILN